MSTLKAPSPLHNLPQLMSKASETHRASLRRAAVRENYLVTYYEGSRFRASLSLLAEIACAQQFGLDKAVFKGINGEFLVTNIEEFKVAVLETLKVADQKYIEVL